MSMWCRSRVEAPSLPLEKALDEPVLGRPARELVSCRQLQLAEHVRHMALDCLDGQVESRGDLLVHVAARDQLEDLTLTRRKLVQVCVARDLLTCAKGVQDEAGQPRREDGVAVRDALD